MEQTTTTQQRSGRDLLGARLFDLLTRRIVAEHPGIDEAFAQRIVDQTGAFLAASANHTGEPLTPSPAVDLGWHAFILHTREYGVWCGTVAGRFLHHVPDEPAEGEPGKAAVERQRTLDAITAAGYRLDVELWPEVTKCSQCHAGCTDSPKS